MQCCCTAVSAAWPKGLNRLEFFGLPTLPSMFESSKSDRDIIFIKQVLVLPTEAAERISDSRPVSAGFCPSQQGI